MANIETNNKNRGMQICSINKYMIDNLAGGDRFLIENYKSGGQFTAQIK